MPMKNSLAAVIRLVRSSRGLAKEDFLGRLDAKHVYNVENAKTNVTLETLENLASVLDIDPIALLVIAASHEQQTSPEAVLKHLAKETRTLRDMGVVDKIAGEFKDGLLAPRPAGRRTSEEKIEAVLRCKRDGMTQRQASVSLGIPSSTVGRIWNR